MTVEQFSSQLGSWLAPIKVRLQSLPSKVLLQAVCALLIVWLLIVVAQFLWFLMPKDAVTDGVSETAGSIILPSSNKSVDIQTLQASHLFGEAGVVAQQAAEKPVDDGIEHNASKTKLDLLLEGIVHTPNAENSIAVIVYQGKQDQYYVGDKLPVGGSVSLAKVLIDHVILDNKGKYESLWLYDDEKQRALKKSSQEQPVRSQVSKGIITDKRNDRKTTALAANYRNKLYENPSSLAQAVKISPAHQDGEIFGYRVSPGTDRQQFSQLGFKSNDIVTAVNDIELDAPSKALEVYKLMRSAKEAKFTIRRNDKSIDVVVSLGDIQ